MLWWQVIFLSLVEGLTEFLPISSTAHLILFSNFLKLSSSTFLTTFQILIQFGAILAVILIYFRLLINNWSLILRIFIASLPAGIIGFLAYGFITKYLLVNLLIIAWSMFIGGVLMIISEFWYKRQDILSGAKLETIPIKKVFFIGCCQILSLIPGVSRSASTILGGLWVKLDRKQATEFSFLMAVPIMLAASSYDLLKNFNLFSGIDYFTLIIGTTISFLSATLAIKFFLHFIKNYDFIIFGIYRIIVGIILLLIILI